MTAIEKAQAICDRLYEMYPMQATLELTAESIMQKCRNYEELCFYFTKLERRMPDEGI